MRKKANQADIEYINNHPDMSSEEICTVIDLSLAEVKKYRPEKKKKEINLGRSKIKLSNGQSVYQMSEDIDSRPSLRNKNTKENDLRTGVYRTK
jgi:hypothetical protein